MTNSHNVYQSSTENIVQTTNTKFYPVDIKVPHHQLRNFISTSDEDWVYFACKHDVYAFHVPSQRRSLLVTVPFLPRCLSAGLGWICVGGDEEGDCAFIRLDRDEQDTRFQVDAALPLRLGATSPATPPQSQPDEITSRLYARPELLIQQFGGDIVNSITVHELSNEGYSDWNEPVAVVSNNDHTVKIYSLLQRQVINELEHPVPMNYALISPDSETLAAVGDGDRAFFYRRRMERNKSALARFPKCGWQLFAIPKLSLGDTNFNDHSFAVAFSPSGHLCAVSSQGGVISVFDMDLLTDLDDEASESALLYCFQSSRTSIWGAIRSMAFSPAPWDLLAWTEDQGRAGIADVRLSCTRQQMLKLESYAGGIERVRMEDLTPSSIKSLSTKGRLIRQFEDRVRLSHDPNDENARRLAEWQIGEDSDSSFHAGLQLSGSERQILDSLGSETMPPPARPFSVNYTNTPHIRPSADDENSTSGNSWSQRIRDARPYLPRRRSSVVLSHNGSTSNSNLAPQPVSGQRFSVSPSRIPDDDASSSDSLPPLMSTNDLTPSARDSSQPLPYDIPPSDPWSVIQSTLAAARATSPSRRTLPPLTASTSANTGSSSALPTTNTGLTSTERHNDRDRQRASLHRRQLLTRTAELEAARQRRIEALASIPSLDQPSSTTATTPPQPLTDIERHQRILRHRAETRERVAAANAASAARATANAARSGLAERVSNMDDRLARRMLLAGSRMSFLDANGNWMAGEATLTRSGDALAGAEADGLGGNGSYSNLSGMMALEREKGVGTAGIGWSVDGRSLFVGTTEGIFEYSINLADRKSFPSLSFA